MRRARTGGVRDVVVVDVTGAATEVVIMGTPRADRELLEVRDAVAAEAAATAAAAARAEAAAAARVEEATAAREEALASRAARRAAKD